MASPYDFKNYQQFIAHELDSERFGRGARMLLAKHLGVQKSLISQVLGGKLDFTPEQALKIGEFLGLNTTEQKCLLLMVSRERAGTQDLKRLYQGDIDRIREKREKLSTHVGAEASPLSDEHYAEYAGAWHHIAVHMCIRNPDLRSVEAIANYLRLDRTTVIRSTKLLERIGFIKSTKHGWEPTLTRFNVSKESPALRSFHANWRHMATHSLDEPNTKDLHYTLVVCIDEKAREKMKRLMLDLAKEFEPVITAADDREVFAINLDLFKVGGSRQ